MIFYWFIYFFWKIIKINTYYIKMENQDKKYTVLVLEDDQILLNAIVENIKKSVTDILNTQITILGVENMEDAEKHLKSRTIDILLVDWHLNREKTLHSNTLLDRMKDKDWVWELQRPEYIISISSEIDIKHEQSRKYWTLVWKPFMKQEVWTMVKWIINWNVKNPEIDPISDEEYYKMYWITPPNQDSRIESKETDKKLWLTERIFWRKKT